MKLTTKMIKAHDPCAKGLKMWKRCFPRGLEWTHEGQLRFIKSECRIYLDWLRDKGLVPIWDMVYVSLPGANLSGADLRGANLRGADLRGANLRDADLHSADLRCANLSGANLSGANLRGADLSGAVMPDGSIHEWESSQCPAISKRY